MATKNVKIVQKEEEEIPVEVIASSIVEIAKAMKVINKTRLTRKAIVTLIHDSSKLPKRDVEIVLNNLDALEDIWLKKKV